MLGDGPGAAWPAEDEPSHGALSGVQAHWAEQVGTPGETQQASAVPASDNCAKLIAPDPRDTSSASRVQGQAQFARYANSKL